MTIYRSGFRLKTLPKKKKNKDILVRFLLEIIQFFFSISWYKIISAPGIITTLTFLLFKLSEFLSYMCCCFFSTQYKIILEKNYFIPALCSNRILQSETASCMPSFGKLYVKENCLTYYHHSAIFLFSKLCICLKLEVR